MHFGTRFVLVLTLATPLMACGDPFLLLPGSALEGTPASAPVSWVFTDETSTGQLESNPGDPYSVNLWFAAMGEHLYVHAGANRNTWVEHLEGDPSVRFRVGESIYDLTASRVLDQDEFDRFSDAWEAKYDTRPRNENAAEAYLFRLSPR